MWWIMLNALSFHKTIVVNELKTIDARLSFRGTPTHPLTRTAACWLLSSVIRSMVTTTGLYTPGLWSSPATIAFHCFLLCDGLLVKVGNSSWITKATLLFCWLSPLESAGPMSQTRQEKHTNSGTKTCTAGKESNDSATVLHRIIKFYTDIHADLVYSSTGYDVIIFFRSAFIKVRENGRRCRLQRLWVEF